MNSLNIIRQGASASRQIRAQMNAGVLTDGELTRLLKKVDEALATAIDEPPPPVEWAKLQGRERFGVIQGDRI